jgi:hypothetical protein
VAKNKKQSAKELDSIYFLKMVLYLVLGSFWVKFTFGDTGQLPIPVGLLIGLLLVHRDTRQLDRKIGMAILLVAMMIGFWTPIGLYIAL